MLLTDDESLSYWDHITGEAVHGPRKGDQLATFPISMTTVAALAVAHPEAQAIESRPGPLARAFSFISGNAFRSRGFLPPGFRKTMGQADPRLPKMTPGLGVTVGSVRRFYPMKTLSSPVVDTIDGQRVTIALGELDGTPHATFEDGSEPQQLMTRWYGYSFTYPGCEIFER